MKVGKKIYLIRKFILNTGVPSRAEIYLYAGVESGG